MLVIRKSKKLNCMKVFALLTASILSPVFTGMAEEKKEMDTELVVNFGGDSVPWRSVDDSVMGGVSRSLMRVESNLAVFEGELSLENNGGFASVRSGLLESDITGFKGVRLKVKGDGKKYQLRIRDSRDGRASHQMTFETKENLWIEVDLPFSEFFAAYRGRRLQNHPRIDVSQIMTMGLLIADKQQGDFRLEIDYVQAYR